MNKIPYNIDQKQKVIIIGWFLYIIEVVLKFLFFSDHLVSLLECNVFLLLLITLAVRLRSCFFVEFQFAILLLVRILLVNLTVVKLAKVHLDLRVRQFVRNRNPK